MYPIVGLWSEQEGGTCLAYSRIDSHSNIYSLGKHEFFLWKCVVLLDRQENRFCLIMTAIMWPPKPWSQSPA